MINLDFNVIDLILKDKTNKNKLCNDNAHIFKQWSYCATNYFNHFTIKGTQYEVAQIIQAQDRYLKLKQSTTPTIPVSYSERQLLMVELGISGNNLSYKHPCVVIGKANDKLFVLPCTSGSAPRDRFRNIYNGYMEGLNTDGFHHLTTVILKEARCIDKSQVLYPIRDNRGKLAKVTSAFYKVLYQSAFELLFSRKAYSVSKLETKNTDLETDIEKLNEEIKRLEDENNSLKISIGILNKELIEKPEDEKEAVVDGEK